MYPRSSFCLFLSLSAACAHVLPERRTDSDSEPSAILEVSIGDLTFVNKGLVAFGLIPSNATESTGDTIGGIGSAIALQLGSFSQINESSYSGTLIVQPDRGYNVEKTIDYQGRHHSIDFTLTPYYGSANLSFEDAQQTLTPEYKSTLLYVDEHSVRTTGLDALSSRNDSGFPELPTPSLSFTDLTVDCEGLALNSDGTFWMSDEYGPYIYKFTSEGKLLEAIAPPEAILPFIDGAVNFTSQDDPDTGRAANQGFEGLTISPDGTTLYALLQSATMQDGGDDDSTSRNTRFLSYDLTTSPPSLSGEWVVPLPVTNGKGKTLAASEVHYVSSSIFLVLSRDGKGHGDDDTESKHKTIDLFDISGATDIHGTEFDDPANPIAADGVVESSITPADYYSFVNLIDSTQLARFGLHNGGSDDETLIDAKWESIALAPVGDDAYPDDYFLFTVADNDFISTQGVFNGTSFDAGEDVDTQFMVYRVTLPTS